MDVLTPYLITIIKCLIAIIAAVFLGNGAVYFFNKMPGHWFVDYGEPVSEELRNPTRQRIKSNPWKFIFTMIFVVLAVYMVIDDDRFAIAALCTIWLLVEMSIGDVLYRIVPDQLIVLTAITAVGYIPYYDTWQNNVLGMLLGFGIMGSISLLGKLLYHHDTVGGGDIKLFATVGFLTGIFGVLSIFVMSTLLSVGYFLFQRIRGQMKEKEAIAMVPHITIATTIYLVFLWGRFDYILIF